MDLLCHFGWIATLCIVFFFFFLHVMEFICSVKCLVYSAAIILAAVCIPWTLQLQFRLPHGKIHLIQMDTILNSCPPRRDRQHSSISIPFKLS